MRVLINQEPHELPEGTTLADAVLTVGANGPYAVAVNLNFVPRTQYAQTLLQEGDHVEIITPAAGG
ncbi:MAG: sulfur carrier protein ThiS [Thermostichus sp. HHBFW_bins_43]